MKLTAYRCGICDTWNGAWRTHCFHCGASPAMKINNCIIHLDQHGPDRVIQITRGNPSDLALRLQSIKG